MPLEFKLPDLGEGIHEGEVLKVLVSVGDTVTEGDSILEIETDKATVEIPSPFTGTVREIRAKEGETARVGDVLMIFDSGEASETVAQKPSAEKQVEKAPGTQPTPDKGPAETPDKKSDETPPERTKGPLPASPATRRLARELGVDLRRVTPTGPGGLVTADDVRGHGEKGGAVEEPPTQEAPTGQAAIGQTKDQPPAAEAEGRTPAAGVPYIMAPPLPDFEKWGPVERIPLRSIRKATARQMALAWSQIPHVQSQDMVDVTRLEEFRSKHKEEVREKGGKLSLTVFALKAAATALKTYPNFNATLDTAKGEIILKHYFHIGVAVNTEGGLIVPVIKDVDRKSILELSVELKELVERTRARKVNLEELQGGTFTITNVGPMGGGFFSPIINYPEVAIMGMGGARMQPVAVPAEGGGRDIVPRLMMPLVLCIDHRALDGAHAMVFMRAVKEALEDPEELFITMT